MAIASAESKYGKTVRIILIFFTSAKERDNSKGLCIIERFFCDDGQTSFSLFSKP